MRLVRPARPKAPLLIPTPLRQASPVPRRRPRVLAGAAATLAVAGLAAGCSSGSGAASATGTITVAAIKGVDTAPLYAGNLPGGTFARTGLHVKIDTFTSVRAEISALRAGKVDVAAGDYVDFLYSQSIHPGLEIVADGYHAAPGVMEVLTLPNSGITTPRQLLGRRVGTPEGQVVPATHGHPYSVETLAAWSVLTGDNIDPTKINWDPMPAGRLVRALKTHQVSAIVAQEPYIYDAESQLGATEVFDACSGPTADLPLTGYFTTRTYARQNTPLLRAFQSELDQAQAKAILPGPVRTVLADDGMTKSAALMTMGAYPTTLNPASPSRVEQLMFSFELLGHALNINAMIFH